MFYFFLRGIIVSQQRANVFFAFCTRARESKEEDEEGEEEERKRRREGFDDGPMTASAADRSIAVDCISLVENFIPTEDEERILASNVYKQEEEKEEEKATWKVLSGRRVKQFGGTVNAQRTIGKPLPKFLKELSLRIETNERVREIFSSSTNGIDKKEGSTSLKLNHVLVNEYQPNEGIASHQDGPLYTNFVCVVSLFRDDVVTFTPHEDFKETLKPFDVFVPRRSLLLFYGKAYDCYLHGINNGGRGGGGGGGGKREDDEFVLENKRISLTFRNVKNLAIPGKAFGALLGKR